MLAFVGVGHHGAAPGEAAGDSDYNVAIADYADRDIVRLYGLMASRYGNEMSKDIGVVFGSDSSDMVCIAAELALAD